MKLNTNRLTPAGYVRATYTAAEVDAIGVYSPELRRCFLIPIAEVTGGRGVHLRLDPTRNNQARRIRWANDYEFGEMLRKWPAEADLPGANRRVH